MNMCFIFIITTHIHYQHYDHLPLPEGLKFTGRAVAVAHIVLVLKYEALPNKILNI